MQKDTSLIQSVHMPYYKNPIVVPHITAENQNSFPSGNSIRVRTKRFERKIGVNCKNDKTWITFVVLSLCLYLFPSLFSPFFSLEGIRRAPCHALETPLSSKTNFYGVLSAPLPLLIYPSFFLFLRRAAV